MWSRLFGEQKSTDAMKTTGICVMCCAKEQTRVFQPCMHVCACDDCASKVDKCPICNEAIVARWRVYLC
jgi:hypothetical protein